MHDIKLIRKNPEAFDAGIVNRGGEPFADVLLEQDEQRRIALTELQELQSAINLASKLAGEAKAKGDEKEFERLRALTKEQKLKLDVAEKLAKEKEASWINLLLNIPNTPMENVPIGKDENDNVVISKWGAPKKFDFEVEEHFNIPAARWSMDFQISAKMTGTEKQVAGMNFEASAKMSGARFVLLATSTARVHRALAQFMLDLHINKHELMEINAPVIVNSNALQGTGQLPKFADDCYKIDDDQWLIPTSEVTLTNIVADRIINVETPWRYCAHSLCFRKEAGAAGRDTAGMLRQHQFEKVEMVSITHPEESLAELNRMTECAENVLKELKLPFRTVVLCTGDLGFSAQRTHDIEVWLPGQKCYREISSVSVCGDFQARRMNTRFREKDGDKPQFVHTLNGSGVAVGRCLIAVLENGQQKDGSVKLPKVLHRYLGYNDTINRFGILENTKEKDKNKT
ncbi:MAG: serine--tRNA ligase [Candidatus Halichondribacter symbioticus]